MKPRLRLRIARPISPPPLRDLSSCECHLHSADLRAKWEAAVTWLRAHEGGSLWLLDRTVERKT